MFLALSVNLYVEFLAKSFFTSIEWPRAHIPTLAFLGRNIRHCSTYIKPWRSSARARWLDKHWSIYVHYIYGALVRRTTLTRLRQFSVVPPSILILQQIQWSTQHAEQTWKKRRTDEISHACVSTLLIAGFCSPLDPLCPISPLFINNRVSFHSSLFPHSVLSVPPASQVSEYPACLNSTSLRVTL